jgi:hypothetical protein
VLLLPQRDHRFEMSGQDTAEQGRKRGIESETGQKTWDLLYANEEGETGIQFLFNARFSVRNIKPVLITTNITGYAGVYFKGKVLRDHIQKKFISIFRRVRKITNNTSFVMSVYLSVRPSVCLSIRMEQVGSYWTNFNDNLYLSLFRQCVVKIQVSLKSDKNKWYFT